METHYYQLTGRPQPYIDKKGKAVNDNPLLVGGYIRLKLGIVDETADAMWLFPTSRRY